MSSLRRTFVLIPLAIIAVIFFLVIRQAPGAKAPVKETPVAQQPTSQLATPEAPAASVAFTSPLASTQPLTLTTSSSPGTVTSTTGISPTVALAGTPVKYTYEVIAVFPHDPNAFTQGLLFDQGILYEGTGLYGESTVRRVDLVSGTVEQQIALPEQFFGEGIAIVGDRLFQLTWREGRGFIYNKTTFVQEAEFTYQTEGWGLTYDGEQLWMSDGSSQLYVLDPATLALVRTINVHDGESAIVQLNELEFINGLIYANIWQTDQIVQIDPTTGAVVGWIDLTGLLPAEDRTASTDVLNGIAYLPQEDRLFVTGKKWPKLFEIRLVALE